MVADKFYLFSNGKQNNNNNNKLPGKSDWKIFNDYSSTPSRDHRSARHQDDWLHIKKPTDVTYKHNSYNSMGSNASSNSSCSSIKIPSNNDYYVLHKRAYKQEVQANKENKTRFPTTTGFEDFRRDNSRDFGGRARSKTIANTTTSTTSKYPSYTSYKPYSSTSTATDKRSPLEKFTANQGDVVMDWVSNMDP